MSSRRHRDCHGRFVRRLVMVGIFVAATVIQSGCHHWVAEHLQDPDPSAQGFYDPALAAPPVSQGAVPNPLVVPVRDQEFTWNQIVDTIDDYFDIRTERRVQQVGAVLTEGRVETYPQPGATALEPWRWDSVLGFERAHATLQSIRRSALVRVLPTGGSYSIHVIVNKELEDVDRPAHATPGAATPLHGRSLAQLEDVKEDEPRTLGWIPMGRDFELENEILQELHGRLFNSADAPPAEIQWPS